jgi:hypothetical protein
VWSENLEPADFGWEGEEPQGPWQQYAELLRRLDVVRAIETARTAGIRASAAQMSEHADALGEYLADQRETLMELARDLRYKVPDWDPIPPGQAVRDDPPDHPADPEHQEFEPGRPLRAEAAPAQEPVVAPDDADAEAASGPDSAEPDSAEPDSRGPGSGGPRPGGPGSGEPGPDEQRPGAPPPAPRRVLPPLEPATGLREAAQLIDRATRAAEKADEVGAAPAFLPHWSAASRNLLIYGLCAALAMLLQAQFLIVGQSSNPVTVWVLTSALAFGIGYFLIRDVGSPRIGRRPRRRSARTGAVLCFLVGPGCLLLFTLGR